MAALRIREDYRTLTGPEKAAIMMLSLGEEHATKLFTRWTTRRSRNCPRPWPIWARSAPPSIERLFVEFAEQISSTGSLMGSYESTERLLMKMLDNDKVDQIMEEIRGPAGRTMWDKLGNVNEAVLANYLKNEYPQTVAVVLSKIKSEHAARVLAPLPEDFALEVVMRMLRMEPVQKEILDKIEQTLRTEFMSQPGAHRRRDSHEMMADIFNNFDRQTESRFITALEERNREAAERIRALMFTFEDLSKLDPGGVQTLLRDVEKDQAGAGPEGRLGNACARCSSPTCPSAPPRSCARTWRPWARCACATSTRRRWPWSRSPRTSPTRARS